MAASYPTTIKKVNFGQGVLWINPVKVKFSGIEHARVRI